MSRHLPLSPEERQKIQDLRASLSLTGYEIAMAVGRSKSVVYKYIRAKHISRWTDKEMSILTEGYLRGKPIAKIARKVCRTPAAVSIKMCRHRKKVRSDPDVKRVIFLLDKALSAGLTPGRAIQKIRTCGAFERSDSIDLQF